MFPVHVTYISGEEEYYIYGNYYLTATNGNYNCQRANVKTYFAAQIKGTAVDMDIQLFIKYLYYILKTCGAKGLHSGGYLDVLGGNVRLIAGVTK